MSRLSASALGAWVGESVIDMRGAPECATPAAGAGFRPAPRGQAAASRSAAASAATAGRIDGVGIRP